MKHYETIAGFEFALRAKLHALATKERTFQDLRKQVAFDRVLARLQAAAPDSWLLKGGLALEYRIARARATLDIDITTELDLNEMSDVLAHAAALDLGDYFQIVIGERERPVDEVETYRFHISVQYANGRNFENIKLDIGFADPWLGTPLEVEIPSIFGFHRYQTNNSENDPQRATSGRENPRLHEILRLTPVIASKRFGRHDPTNRGGHRSSSARGNSADSVRDAQHA